MTREQHSNDGRLVFLDIDGVLNYHEPLDVSKCGHIHPDKVARLNRILMAGGRYVVSSAWRYLVHCGEMNPTGLEWLLRSHGVAAGKMDGITVRDSVYQKWNGDNPNSWIVDNERGVQIEKYLEKYWAAGCFPSYVVLDDMDLGITERGHPFVHVDSKVGLTDDNADAAIKILRRILRVRYSLT